MQAVAEREFRKVVTDSGLHEAFHQACQEALRERPADVFGFVAARLRARAAPSDTSPPLGGANPPAMAQR